MKRFFSIIICFIIFNCIHFSVEARRNYVSVYDLNGKETNQVSITISELIWKNNNDYTLTVDSELKRPISIEPLISENAKDYEQVIIMDFKTDDAENPYPEIESMDVAIKHPIPSGGWRLLGKDYRLMYFFEDTVEDLSANITDSDENEVNFTVDKLGKYVIYLNPRVYDLIFYDGEPIPIDEEEYIMPGIYYEIEEISKEEFVVFPEIPKKDGYVFTGWKAWSGSGIYYINTQPIQGNRYWEYYASWCPENEYEPINIEISSDESITKGKEEGKKVTLRTNYGIFINDEYFPAEWRDDYEKAETEEEKQDILSYWKTLWNVVGSDELLIESVGIIDNKTLELTLSGNSSDIYSNSDIYIEFDSALLMPEPYELNGEIIDWDDTKIKMDEDGVRARMYRSDNAVKLSKQSKPGTGGGVSLSKYTVTFDTNGGNSISKQTLSRNATVKEPEAPQKEGYNFVGWFTDKEFTKEFDFTTKITKSITLYAKWDIADITKDQIIFTIGKTKATVFGEEKQNDVAPVIYDDRAYLPARFVAENLGATVEWNEDVRTVTIKKDDVTVVITISAETAIVNGETITLEKPAFIENDRTYTPIRFVVEKLGCEVLWNDKTQEIVITK